MSLSSIKITALNPIGANIAYTTLIPVVNMAETPTTQKATAQVLGNLILNSAGGSYFPPAAQAVLAQSVTNAAQPNITSVGTLTALTVSGNIVAGNVNGGNLVVANYFSGDGGFLTNVTANGTYSNSNVANYLPTYTGNVGAGNVNVTGTVYANGLSSTGLSSLTILNVSTTANLGAVGNVRITGGSNGQVLTTNGNGVLSWVNGGGGAELVNGDNSFVLNANGNVVFEGDVAGQGVDRGLVWDFGANANGVNSEVRQDNSGLSVRAWTEDGGGANGYSAPVNIVTNQDANEKQWVFDGDGNLTLPGNLRLLAGNIVSGTIAPAFDSAITGITTGNATVVVTLTDSPFDGPFQGEVTISGVVGTTEANGTWYYEAVEQDQFQLYTDNTFTTPVDGTTWTTYVSGGNAVSTGTYLDLTIQGGNVSINSDGEIWEFRPDGSTIYPTLSVTRGDRTGTLTGQTILFGDSTQEAILTTPNGTNDINSSQRFVINPGAGYANTTGEGGDIYLYAGRGGDAGGSGGDIKIRGGLGPVNGYGGYLDLQGGEAAGNGHGGYIDIRGGESVNAIGGNINIDGGQGGTNGGGINIQGGYGGAGDGGNINITGGGSANGLSQYGNVNIVSGASTWTFSNDGNLTIPGNVLTATNTLYLKTSNAGLRVQDIPGGGSTLLDTDGYPWLAYFNQSSFSGPEISYSNANSVDYFYAPNVFSSSMYIGGNGMFIELDYNETLGNTVSWQFSNDGNLILAGGNSIVRSVANSSLDPLNPNVSTMVLTPDAGYSSQSLVLDPTAPGHIHLRAPGANIDEPLSNIFLGGETSSFEVGYYNGGAPNVFVHSGNNTWTFDNAGVLTVPGEGIINSFDDVITLKSSNTVSGNSNSVYLGTSGGLGFQDTSIVGNWLEIFRNGSDPQLGTPGNLLIRADSTNTAPTWTFGANGNLSVPGDISGASITASNAFTLTANTKSWIFDADILGNEATLTLGSGLIQNDDGRLRVVSYGANNSSGPELTYANASSYANINDSGVMLNTMYINSGGFFIDVDSNDNYKGWAFNTLGEMVFPDNTVQTTAWNGTENFYNKTGATGVVVHDCANGAVFYHTSIAGNFTANITNLPVTANTTGAVTLVLSQGATPYVCNAVQINGSAQTILWQGSASAPTGNANKTDIISFSIMRTGASTYIVFGQLVSFG